MLVEAEREADIEGEKIKRRKHESERKGKGERQGALCTRQIFTRTRQNCVRVVNMEAAKDTVAMKPFASSKLEITQRCRYILVFAWARSTKPEPN